MDVIKKLKYSRWMSEQMVEHAEHVTTGSVFAAFKKQALNYKSDFL